MAETDTAPVSPPPSPPQEVFLSPRVVDQAAFDEFAGALRELIAQAEAQAEPLRATSTQAEKTLAAVREASGRQQARLDLALKVMATVDERLGKVELALGRATEAAAAMDRLESRAEEIVNAKLSEFATRVQSESQSAAGRLAAVEQRAGVVERELAEKLSRLEELTGRRGGGGGPGVLDQLLQRGEVLAESASGAVQRLESLKDEVSDAHRELVVMLSDSAGRVREISAEQRGAQESLQSALAMCREATEAMAEREQSLRQALQVPVEQIVAQADAAAENLRSLLAQTERATSIGRALVQEQIAAAKELSGMLERLEPWRR